MINVMDEYISFTIKCFHNYLKLFFKDYKYDKKIAEEFINAYLNVRYSNYIDEASKNVSLQRKISKVIQDTAKRLEVEYGKDKVDVIDKIAKFAQYFYHLDQLYLLEAQKNVIQSIATEKEKLFGEDKDFVNQFSMMIRDDIKIRKEFLDNFESPTFYLDYKKIGKNEFFVKLENKIVFPELYSDIAIKKASEKDSISEDMVAITYLQLASVVVKDLVGCNFDKSYFVEFPESLFDKKTKINRVLNIIDNLFIQDRIRIVISYKCFLRYGTYVREYMRKGYFFAIILDDSFDYSSDNIQYLELFEKIFFDFNKYYYKDMKKSVKIKDRIISVDEVK